MFALAYHGHHQHCFCNLNPSHHLKSSSGDIITVISIVNAAAWLHQVKAKNEAASTDCEYKTMCCKVKMKTFR